MIDNNKINKFDIYTWNILDEPLESLYNLNNINKIIYNLNIILDDIKFINWIIQLNCTNSNILSFIQILYESFDSESDSDSDKYL